MARSLVAVIVIAHCLLQSLVPGQAANAAAATGIPEPNQRKGLNLFNIGEGVSFENQELARLRNLHSRDFSDVEEFLGSASLADYLGLAPLDSLHLPVPLHVVLLGFAGDGNGGVNVPLEELQDWFGHLDHVLPHTRIDRAELTCQEDGQCAGLVHGRFHPTPMPSHVHLNFTCNVVRVARRSVVDAFERAIAAFSRPVDPDVVTGMQQVDATKMEALVDHLLSALGLESSYSLVVLNPTWHVEEPVYGYRVGVSGPELQLLRGQAERLRKVMAANRESEPALPPHHRSGTWNSASHVHPNAQVDTKFAQKDASWDSERWVSTVTSYLAREEAHRRGLLAAAGQERGAAAHAQAARLLARPGSDMGAVLRKDLFEPWGETAESVHSTFHSAHPAEDCLVHTWVGSSGRWALLDLTAGGKDWGPALGGEGVVHHGSLPSVHELFGELARMKERSRRELLVPGSHDAQLAESLAQARAARLPSVANRHHHAFMLMRQRRAAMSPPGAPSPGPDDAAAAEEEERQWRARHQTVLLQAELDVLEEWALRFCHGQPSAPRVCATWRDESVAMRSLLGKLHGAGDAEAVYELFREHRWEIFGQQTDAGVVEAPILDEADMATDALMGELAGALSRAIRHVIAPPTAAWAARPTAPPPVSGPTHGSSGAAAAAAAAAGNHGSVAAGRTRGHTTAPPFAYQVNFHIYIISDTSRHLRNLGSAARTSAFDVEGYKAAVDSLRMHNQVFRFSVQRVNLLDEPALASGLAAATRTTLQEVPTSEDFFDAGMERVFVDSAELAASLRAHFPPTRHQAQREEAAGRPGRLSVTTPVRDLPVYVFQLEREHAVLLDSHYNARALEDMVLVVANAARRDEHPTGMMCGGSLVARPLSPLKEALAASLVALGGVLPPHLGFHPASGTLAHDWLWSVGAHPLSFTSTGLRYSALQRDALARSHLLDALDACVEAVNGAVRLLAAARTTRQLHAHVQAHAHGARDLLRKFGDVVSGFRSAASVAYSLDYATALEYVRAMEGDVNDLLVHAQAVATLAEPVRCSAALADRLAPLLPLAYLAGAALLLLALLYAVAPRRKTKAM